MNQYLPCNLRYMYTLTSANNLPRNFLPVNINEFPAVCLSFRSIDYPHKHLRRYICLNRYAVLYTGKSTT
jgi:hypothetical protein